jgi:hypothetical protein
MGGAQFGLLGHLVGRSMAPAVGTTQASTSPLRTAWPTLGRPLGRLQPGLRGLHPPPAL